MSTENEHKYLRMRLRAAKALADAEGAAREAMRAVAWLDADDPEFATVDHAGADIMHLLESAARDLRCAMAVLNNTTLGGGS